MKSKQDHQHNHPARLCIQAILSQYEQLGGFPFLDWARAPSHRAALRDLWSDIFKAAAGQMALQYHAVADIESDHERAILYLVTRDWQRRIRSMH